MKNQKLFVSVLSPALKSLHNVIHYTLMILKWNSNIKYLFKLRFL